MTCRIPSDLRNSRFSGSAGGGENFNARALGQLDRRLANAAGRRVNQQPLAALHSAHLMQRKIGGQKHQRKSRRFGKSDLLWLGQRLTRCWQRRTC